MKERNRRKRRDSGRGNGRARRRGRLRMADRIPAANAVYPREDWGRRSAHVFGAHDHLACDLIRVPEGMAIVARCEICGGRHEGVIDERAANRAADPDAAFLAGLDIVRGQLECEWIPRHRSCPEAASKHHLPLVVEEFVGAVEGIARMRIAAGEAMPAMIYLLDVAGEAYALPIHDVPPSTPESNERRIELAARHSLLRELVRACDLDLLAAISVGEAWGEPHEPGGTAPQAGHAPRSPGRTEHLLLAVVTSTAGWLATGEIQREGGRIDEGPGTVEPLAWSALQRECGLLDTLLATTGVLP